MLKAAMVDEELFDKCILANSCATKDILLSGSWRLWEAAQGGDFALAASLASFKAGLLKKRFSAASTDTLLIDAGAMATKDSVIVCNIMDQLVDTFANSWADEQVKQRALFNRLKTDVPLLTWTPRSLKDTLASPEPAIILCVLVLAGGPDCFNLCNHRGFQEG